MSMMRPKFMDSPYFVEEPDNWHLLPGAPKEVVEEFEAFMREDERCYKDEEKDHAK